MTRAEARELLKVAAERLRAGANARDYEADLRIRVARSLGNRPADRAAVSYADAAALRARGLADAAEARLREAAAEADPRGRLTPND